MRNIAFVDADVATFGGRCASVLKGLRPLGLPVKSGADLTAKGHPPDATGVAKFGEPFVPLCGDVTHQVDGARVALAHNVGSPTAVSAVSILGRTR